MSPGVCEPSHCRQNVPCVFGWSVSPVSSAPRRGRTLPPPLTDAARALHALPFSSQSSSPRVLAPALCPRYPLSTRPSVQGTHPQERPLAKTNGSRCIDAPPGPARGRELYTTSQAPRQVKLPAPTGGNHGNRLLTHLP